MSCFFLLALIAAHQVVVQSRHSSIRPSLLRRSHATAGCSRGPQQVFSPIGMHQLLYWPNVFAMQYANSCTRPFIQSSTGMAMVSLQTRARPDPLPQCASQTHYHSVAPSHGAYLRAVHCTPPLRRTWRPGDNTAVQVRTQDRVNQHMALIAPAHVRLPRCLRTLDVVLVLAWGGNLACLVTLKYTAPGGQGCRRW